MTITLNGITLSPELLWEDEFTENTISQTVKSTLSGGTVVYSGQRQSRNITLQSLPDQGWMTRDIIEQIQAIANVPSAVYTLSLRGVDYSVMFRHNEPPAFKAEPVSHIANPTDGTYYTAQIKLLTV